MDRLSLFWVLIAISTLLFVAGLWVNASIWLGGSVEGASGAGKRNKLAVLGRGVLRNAFGGDGEKALRAMVVDGHLHPRLAAASKGRWLAHTSLALAFVAMFLLSLFTGFFEQILHNVLGLSSPLISAVIDKDTPVMALLNEALGVVMIPALAFILVRRYVQRPEQLRTSALDTWTLMLMGLGLLTAYPVEALRFLAEGAPASGAWASFGGYSLYLLLRPLSWPWAALHDWMFFAHVLPFMALLVYTPFSKFFHMVVSPLVVVAGRLSEEASR